MIGYPSLQAGLVTDWRGLPLATIIEVRSGVIIARVVGETRIVYGVWTGEREATEFVEQREEDI